MESYKGKNILIFGLGINQGGLGAAKFFAKAGANVKVTDLKNKEQLKDPLVQLKNFKNISYTLGGHKNGDIDWADLIIKNPAVKPGNKYIYYVQKKKKKIDTDLGIFFKLVKRENIIGITGTKGKTTTASLIYQALSSNLGKDKVVLAGNIGKSILDCLEYISNETLVVLEISSFQMEGLIKHQVSPKYALITNIYPDHLNYHPNINSYIEAKRMLGFYQTNTDYLFLNRDDTTLNNSQFLENLKANIIFYSSVDLPVDFKPVLLGRHNLQNYAAALAICKKFNIPETLALNAMNKFKGAKYRMETIKTWKGIKIINDSTATNPNATIEALKTLEPNIILICGGMNKGMNYQQLAKVIDQKAKSVYLLVGDSTDEIKELINKKLIAGEYDNLKKLLKEVKTAVKPGDTVLFSPGATSFNIFQNEFDRGDKFNQAVGKVFKD